jgi:hypothetical protein
LYQRELNEKLQQQLWGLEDAENWGESIKERMSEKVDEIKDMYNDSNLTWSNIEESIK